MEACHVSFSNDRFGILWESQLWFLWLCRVFWRWLPCANVWPTDAFSQITFVCISFFYWLIFFYFESRLKINFKVNTLLSNDAVSWMIVMEKDFFLKIWMTAVQIFVSKHPVICFWFISVVNFVTLLSLT